MEAKILLVDDDPVICAFYARHCRKLFDFETAEGPERGLEALEKRGPFAVVVSDLQMPAMNGIEFLAKVRERSPESVRLMLTASSDSERVIRSINEGHIFQYLTKPCSPEVITRVLIAAINEYRLRAAEREILEKTLAGAVRVLTDILAIVDPKGFDRALALRENIQAFERTVKVNNSWQLEMAAMLAQIGRVAVPASLLQKATSRQTLIKTERELLDRVPELGAKLLANIPRLEQVAEIVRYQSKNFDGSGMPADTIAGEAIPLGARMLRIMADLTELTTRGENVARSLEVMIGRRGWYDPFLLKTAQSTFASDAQPTKADAILSRPIRVAELRLGQVLRSNIETLDGTLLIAAGRELTEAVLERIRNFARVSTIKEPLLISIPAG